MTINQKEAGFEHKNSNKMDFKKAQQDMQFYINRISDIEIRYAGVIEKLKNDIAASDTKRLELSAVLDNAGKGAQEAIRLERAVNLKKGKRLSEPSKDMVDAVASAQIENTSQYNLAKTFLSLKANVTAELQQINIYAESGQEEIARSTASLALTEWKKKIEDYEIFLKENS